MRTIKYIFYLCNMSKFSRFQERIFDVIIYVSYVLIILSSLGIWNSASKYLYHLDYYVRIYICIFLIIRFNPFLRYYEFTSLDRKIAFSAGLFILTTTVLNTYLTDAKMKVSSVVKKQIEKTSNIL